LNLGRDDRARAPVAPVLTVLPYRFTFRPLDPISFPIGKAANTLRGALGLALRRISCPAACEKPGPGCDCPYARLFAPRSLAGPSGFSDPPRPFVLRTIALDGRSFPPKSVFSFDLHLFANDTAALIPIAQAFQATMAEGLGSSHSRVELTSIEVLNEARHPARRIYPATRLEQQPAGLVLPLSPDIKPISEVRVNFVTPTELKHEGVIVENPEFFILMARLRDRISALATLYGSGPLEIDHIGLTERARGVHVVASDLSWVAAERRSSRTGQRHPLGGFVGRVTYCGPLAEFMPWLRAGYWTGVGRQTVWGKGVIDLASTIPP
jgi:hypothetical protein